MGIGQHYYTWCHRDVGCEGIAGFQTRARSGAITPEVERIIKQYCSLYVLPRSLENLTTKADDLTAAELRQCPQILYYYPISSELWGLTRSRLSANQRGRGGNFFAHTLVLPAKIMGSVDSNPFELTRSDVMKFIADDSCGKQLDEILEPPDLSSAVEYRQRMITKCCGVGTDRLRNILSAILSSGQGQKKRPIILCTSKFQGIADIIEAILVLLPPAYRCTVAFSTYEPDPYRLFRGDESADLMTNWIIGTIPQAEGGKFQFREDEFQTGFYVFDLDGGRQSATPPPSEYVRQICDGLDQSNGKVVGRIQQIITAVGVSKNPELWDMILPAEFLLSDSNGLRDLEKWKFAIEALIKCSRTPEGASQAIEILWNKSHKMLSQLEPEILAKVISGCKDLLKKAEGATARFIQKEKGNLISTFDDLLQARRYEIAGELLSLVGDKGGEIRRTIIIEGLIIAQSKGWPTPSLPDKDDDKEVKAFVTILDEGLRSLVSDKTRASVFGDLIEKCFSGAQSCGCFKAVWSDLSAWLFAEGLREVLPEHVSRVLKTLGAVLVKEGEYEGRMKLGLWELKNIAPSDKNRRTEILKEITTACGQSADTMQAVRDTLSEVTVIFRKCEEDLIALFVILFAQVEDQAGDEVLKQYRAYVNSKHEESARWNIRRRISSLPSGQNLLAAECALMLFPWKPDSARSCIRAWISEVIRSDDEFACLVSRKISEAVKMQEEPSVASEILTTCLSEFSKGGLYKKASGILAEILVTSIPLEQFKHLSLADLIGKVDTSEWGRETMAFLQIAECYAQAKRQQNSDYPDISSLIKDYHELPRTISCLSDEHWQQSAKWIVSGFRGLEVENRTSVASLIMLVISPIVQDEASSQSFSGQRSETLDRSLVVANMIVDQLRSELLQGHFRRDPSTHVCVLSLFVILAPAVLRQTRVPHDDLRLGSVARIVGCILAEDRALTKRLLWQRLQTHGGLDSRQWQPWLRTFWKQVRLEMRAQRRQRSFIRSLGRLVKRMFARDNRSIEQKESRSTAKADKKIVTPKDKDLDADNSTRSGQQEKKGRGKGR